MLAPILHSGCHLAHGCLKTADLAQHLHKVFVDLDCPRLSRQSICPDFVGRQGVRKKMKKGAAWRKVELVRTTCKEC